MRRRFPEVTALVAALALPGIGLVSAIATSPALAGPTEDTLKLVATFDHQVTGVAVARSGRVFVSFPRWSEDVAISVAELDRKGKVAAFPDAAWNAWRNAKADDVSAGDHFVCVQAVYADARDHLWVVDAASPGQAGVVKGGAKLVDIDLATNKVAKVYPMPDSVALQGSYLNDIRVAPDGKFAFVTDSGARGAIIVVDLATGRAHRALDADPATQPDRKVDITADGKPLRRPDGRTLDAGADGIALSPDGKTLYFQAIRGKTLYRVATADLVAGAKARPVKVGDNGVADGLWIDARTNRMFVTSPEDNSVYARDLSSTSAADPGKPYLLIGDPRLRWPDTFAQGPDGTLYVTASHIQDSATYKPGAPLALRTELFALTPM